MNTICILVVLCLCVSYGDESCDRKEMEATICSLCSQRKGNQSGTKITTAEIYLFQNYISLFYSNFFLFLKQCAFIINIFSYLTINIFFQNDTLDFGKQYILCWKSHIVSKSSF